MKKYLAFLQCSLVVIILLLLNISYSPPSFALNLSDESYTIDVDDSLEPFTSQENTATQQPPEEENSWLSIALDTDRIEFDPLTPTNPLIRDQKIAIQSKNGYGFQLFLIQAQPLANENKVEIPQASCDDGACASDHTSSWNNILTYGFGYQCSENILCEEAFSEANSFRPLDTDLSSASIIINSHQKTSSEHAKLTYKVNVPGSQQPGLYRTTLQLLVLPNL